MARTIQEILVMAVNCQQEGKLGEAEALYRDVLKAEPNTAQALYRLGLIASRSGAVAAAIQLYERAIAADGGMVEVYNSLGTVLASMGRLGEAEETFRRGIARDGGVAMLHTNLGNALGGQGKLKESAEAFRKAIAPAPAMAEAHANLGNVLREMKELENALVECDEAIRLKPGFADAHNNRGNVLREMGRYVEAEEAHRKALELRPKFPGAMANLGSDLLAQKRFDEAMGAYRAAPAMSPGDMRIRLNVGRAYMGQRRMKEAMEEFRAAIKIAPNLAEGHALLADVLGELGLAGEALSESKTAVELDPKLAQVHLSLGVALKNLHRPTEAIEEYRKAIELKLDFAEVHANLAGILGDVGLMEESIAEHRRVLSLRKDMPESHSNMLFGMNANPKYDGMALLEEHAAWGKQYAAPLAGEVRPHANKRIVDRKLRVGYVSADFRRHSVAYFFEPILAGHDRERIELFCYSNSLRSDEVTERMKSYGANWRDIVQMTDTEAAELIRKDEIDILVDLSGHSAYNRLLVFARKPAPIQVTYLGYPGTSGVETMDYRVTDASADPVGETEGHYVERLVRLPGCAWCYRPPEEAPDVAERELGDAVTFGCFNNFAKVTDETLRLWGRVLMECEGSRLVMKCQGLAEQGVMRRVWEVLAKEGVDQGRVEMLGRSATLKEHLAEYERIDIALDTFPYNGTTTTCEALWMGVPVISLAGERHASRVGASLLASIGLGKLAADSQEKYVEAAGKLARDKGEIAAMHPGLRQRMAQSALCDGGAFVFGLEEAYRRMWEKYCAGA